MNPYLVEFETTDEDGDTEHWKVQYRRILTETYLAITDVPVTRREEVERIHRYLPSARSGHLAQRCDRPWRLADGRGGGGVLEASNLSKPHGWRH